MEGDGWRAAFRTQVGCTQQEGGERRDGGCEASDTRSLGTDSGHGALGITEIAGIAQSSWVFMVIRE